MCLPSEGGSPEVKLVMRAAVASAARLVQVSVCVLGAVCSVATVAAGGGRGAVHRSL